MCGDCVCFFFNDTATTEIYTLSLHDALPIYDEQLYANKLDKLDDMDKFLERCQLWKLILEERENLKSPRRSEEHTSELQSRQYLVCRLLLEKKKKINIYNNLTYRFFS